jgi:hypothetical protein
MIALLFKTFRPLVVKIRVGSAKSIIYKQLYHGLASPLAVRLWPNLPDRKKINLGFIFLIDFTDCPSNEE